MLDYFLINDNALLYSCKIQKNRLHVYIRNDKNVYSVNVKYLFIVHLVDVFALEVELAYCFQRVPCN